MRSQRQRENYQQAQRDRAVYFLPNPDDAPYWQDKANEILNKVQDSMTDEQWKEWAKPLEWATWKGIYEAAQEYLDKECTCTPRHDCKVCSERLEYEELPY